MGSNKSSVSGARARLKCHRYTAPAAGANVRTASPAAVRHISTSTASSKSVACVFIGLSMLALCSCQLITAFPKRGLARKQRERRAQKSENRASGKWGVRKL